MGGYERAFDRPGNANILWGLGSKFGRVTVLREFVDTTDPRTGEYVYIVGSGEAGYIVDLQPVAAAGPTIPTLQIYMARIHASEESMERGDFEYYVGTGPGGGTEWSRDYPRAVALSTPLEDRPYWSMAVSSIAKFGDTYFMAVSVDSDWRSYEPAVGMWVLTSEDGFTWYGHAMAFYSDLREDCNPLSPGYDCLGTPSLVYGHFWVPERVMSYPRRIAYTFSVWKRYWGYFREQWFSDGGIEWIEEPGLRFRNYNTKMYWFNVPL